MNNNLRPEDFWPDAEKLLDRHFLLKRRKTRIVWFFAAMTIAVSAIYFGTQIIDHRTTESKTTDNSIIVTENTMTSPEHPAGESRSTDVNNNSSSDNSTPKNNLSENNSFENKKTLNDNRTTINDNSTVKNTTSLNNKTTAPASTSSSDKIANALENRSSVARVNRNTNSGNNNVNSTSVGYKRRNSTASDANSASQLPSLPQSPEIGIPLTLDRNEKIALMQNSAFGEFTLDHFSNNEIIEKNGETFPLKSLKFKESRLDVRIGGNMMTKTISGYSNEINMNKRIRDEKEIITPELNIEYTKMFDRYSFSFGVNYVQYGEKVNYDPTYIGKVPVDNSYWNTFLTTVTVTDTNFIFGIIYLTQQTVHQLDSNYITQIDTVEQTRENPNIKKANGTNVISYIEVPFSASYYFGKNKFRYGISAGVSAGYLAYSKGYYLNQSGNDVISLKDDHVLNKFLFNGHIGLDLRYMISPSVQFLLHPQYRMNLNSILDSRMNATQKYSSTGVTAGLSFLIR